MGQGWDVLDIDYLLPETARIRSTPSTASNVLGPFCLESLPTSRQLLREEAHEDVMVRCPQTLGYTLSSKGHPFLLLCPKAL